MYYVVVVRYLYISIWTITEFIDSLSLCLSHVVVRFRHSNAAIPEIFSIILYFCASVTIFIIWQTSKWWIVSMSCVSNVCRVLCSTGCVGGWSGCHRRAYVRWCGKTLLYVIYCLVSWSRNQRHNYNEHCKYEGAERRAKKKQDNNNNDANDYDKQGE